MHRLAINGAAILLAVAGISAFVASTPERAPVEAQEPNTAVEMDVMPTEGKAAAIIHTPTEGRWIVMTSDLMPVQAKAHKLSSGGSIIRWQGDPGSVFVAFFFPVDQSEGIGVRRVVLGKEAPSPPPPDPDDPDPPTPDPDIPWDADGLHCMIIDDENVRGNLPQSQVNIFTSKPLRDWLDDNAKYRFSSNDSLAPGDKARDLEKPVWVVGFDTAMRAVKDGKLSLPVWILSNGKTGTIEALPESVDAAIRRLEEFK